MTLPNPLSSAHPTTLANMYSDSPIIPFRGGLGDVIRDLWLTPRYETLSNPSQHHHIALYCGNPHISELFHYHPNRVNFSIHDFYHLRKEPNHDLDLCCTKHGLDPANIIETSFDNPNILPPDGPTHFHHPTYYPKNFGTNCLHSHFHWNKATFNILIQPGAGHHERSIPIYILQDLIPKLCSIPKHEIYLLYRTEEPPQCLRQLPYNNLHILTNQTIPVSLRLLRSCDYAILSHSSFFQEAMLSEIQCTCLYPDAHWQWAKPTKYTWAAFDNSWINPIPFSGYDSNKILSHYEH